MKKPLRIKPVFTLDEKDQSRRAAVIARMNEHGMPENVVDSYIYRVGLDAALKHMTSQLRWS